MDSFFCMNLTNAEQEIFIPMHIRTPPNVTLQPSGTPTRGVSGGGGGGGGGGGQSLLNGELRIALYAVIFVLSVTGNTLVILTLAQNRRMRTLTNVLLLNLSIADLLLALFCMPFTLIPTLLQNFIFGKAMCVLVRYMQGVSVGVSVFTLVAISLERYFAICRPLHSRRWQTVSHSYRIIVAVWTLSFLLMVPIAAYQRVLPLNSGAFKCVEVWSEKRSEMVYTVFLDIVLLVLPLSVMMTAYGLISYTLWEGTSAHENGQTQLTESRDSLSHLQIAYDAHSTKDRCVAAGNYPRHKIETDRAKTPMTKAAVGAGAGGPGGVHHLLAVRHTSADRFIIAKKRIIRMLFVVVLEFFICWTPMYVLQTWIVFDYAGAVTRVSAVAMNLLHLLGFVSSCCHPITYCFMNKRFRHGFLAVFRCCPFARRRSGGGDLLQGRRRTSCSAGELYSLEMPRRHSHSASSSPRFVVRSSISTKIGNFG